MTTAWLAAAALCSADAPPAPPRWALPAWAERLRESAAAPFRKRPAGPTDAVLKLRCRDALFADRSLRASGLEVDVAGGAAILRGTVPSADDARRAERLVRGVRELKGVRNELRPANPFDADRLPAEFALAGEIPPAPPPRVVPASPDAAAPTTPVALRLSKPRAAGAPIVARGVPFAPEAPAPNRLPPREAGAIVGRPISVLVSPDLPRVVEYTIRRALAAPPSELLPAVAAGSAFVDPPRKRPGLVRSDAPGVSAQTLAPRTLEPLLGMVEPPRDELEAALREDPAFARLRYRRDGAEVVLFGAAPDAAALFSAIERLGALPGVGAVGVDRANLKLDRP